MTATYLVTGATGHTGGYLATELRRQGHAVRALVHKMDARAEPLQPIGAEIFEADLLDLDAVSAAMRGIEAAYFVYPIRPGLVEATAIFAQAGRDADLGSLVNMSQISARRDSKSHAARDHWIAERVFDWSGLAVTHVRPTFFAEWLTYPHNRKPIVERGVISQPLGEGRHAPIAAEDQARFIAAVMTKPEAHRGKTYPLLGPVEMSQAEQAEAVSEVLGKPVSYDPISIDVYRQRLESAGVMPAFLIQHLCAVAQDYQDGIFVGSDDVIARVTGHAPMTIQQFVAKHRALFASS